MMKLRGSHVRWVVGFILAVALLAAVPLAVSTPIRLWQIGPPPVITLEDGRVLGQMTITGWSEAFYFAVFQWSPPEKPSDLTGFAWPAAKGSVVTLILVMNVMCLVAGAQKDEPAGLFTLAGLGGCVLAFVLAGLAYPITGVATVVALLVYAGATASTGWFYGRRLARAVAA